jgi:23S rRNA (cytosine1962-C5)-methyltransferase
MSNDLFIKMLKNAASEANVQLKQIEVRQQCADHPILWNVPETDYLKFYIFQVI